MRQKTGLASAIAVVTVVLATVWQASITHATPIVDDVDTTSLLLNAMKPVVIEAAAVPTALSLTTSVAGLEGNLAQMPLQFLQGETLEQVLRSIVMARPLAGLSGAPHAGGGRGAGSLEENELARAYKAAYRMMLESQALADAVRWAIESQTAKDGTKTFSLFGHGRFELDIAGQGNELRLSELSSGVSVPVAEKPVAEEGQGAEKEPGEGVTRANEQLKIFGYLDRILRYARSTEGKFILLIAGTLLLLVGAVRTGLHVSRRNAATARPMGASRNAGERPPPAVRPIATGAPRRA